MIAYGMVRSGSYTLRSSVMDCSCLCIFSMDNDDCDDVG